MEPTDSPTYSPTEAPTRAPHSLNTGDYDTQTYVIYRFSNISLDNCYLVFNWESTGSIDKIQEILEQMYWDMQFLPNYEYFQIKITLINRIDYMDTDQFSIGTLSNFYVNGIREMHVRVTIYHHNQYLNHFEASSGDPVFWNDSTVAFRKYFENPYLNFTVANASSITHTVSAATHHSLFQSLCIITVLAFIVCDMY